MLNKRIVYCFLIILATLSSVSFASEYTLDKANESFVNGEVSTTKEILIQLFNESGLDTSIREIPTTCLQERVAMDSIIATLSKLGFLVEVNNIDQIVLSSKSAIVTLLLLTTNTSNIVILSKPQTIRQAKTIYTGDIWVNGYTTKKGKKVKGYYRHNPNGYKTIYDDVPVKDYDKETIELLIIANILFDRGDS